MRRLRGITYCGDVIEAVRQTLTTGDGALTRRAITQYWLRLILDSETAALEELCITQGDPRDSHTLLIRACCRDLRGDAYGAGFLRGQGLRRIGADIEHDFVACFAELLLAPDTASKAMAADRAHRALARCTPDDDYPSALFLLGWAEVRLRRDFSRAIALLRSACEEAALQSRPGLLRLAQSNLAFALTHAGLFSEAAALLDQLPAAATSTDWDRFEGGSPQSNRGCIAFWRGDFEPAIGQFDSIIAEGSPGTDFEALARLYLVMSVIAVQRTDRYLAAGQLLQGVSTADKHGVPWDTLRRVTAACLAAAQGATAEALRIATPALARPGAPVAHALLAELFRQLEEPNLARKALQLAQSAALPRYARVSALVTAAGLHSQAGQGAAAHEMLEQALDAARGELIRAPFLAPDATLADLLSAHARWGSGHTELLRELLERRGERQGSAGALLTARERQVLARLRTPLTAEEIAGELGVAYPTVKTHIRSIYRKLGVTQRREAVAAADLPASAIPAGQARGPVRAR